MAKQKFTRDECVEFKGVTVLRESEKAILCVVDGEEYWIPKSQIHDDSEVYEDGTEGTLVVSEWIAREKNLV